MLHKLQFHLNSNGISVDCVLNSFPTVIADANGVLTATVPAALGILGGICARTQKTQRVNLCYCTAARFTLNSKNISRVGGVGRIVYRHFQRLFDSSGVHSQNGVSAGGQKRLDSPGCRLGYVVT